MGFNSGFKGLKSSTCFEHCPAHLQEVYVVIVYMQPLVSSLSAVTCSVPLYVAAVGTPWTLLGSPSDDIHFSKNIYSDLNTFTATLADL